MFLIRFHLQSPSLSLQQFLQYCRPRRSRIEKMGVVWNWGARTPCHATPCHVRGRGRSLTLDEDCRADWSAAACADSRSSGSVDSPYHLVRQYCPSLSKQDAEFMCLDVSDTLNESTAAEMRFRSLVSVRTPSDTNDSGCSNI